MFTEEIIIDQTDPDKNGTVKVIKKVPCGRCGGTGVYTYSTQYGNDRGVCYKCRGAEFLIKKEAIHTPEHRAKLDHNNKLRAERERKKRLKKESDINKEKFGDITDSIFLVTERNSFSIKVDLKNLDCIFDKDLGFWFSKTDIDKYATKKINNSDFLKLVEGEYLLKDMGKYHELRAERKRAQGAFVGSIKERIECNLTLINTFNCDTIFGTTYIHKFVDDDQNVLVWKTKTAFVDYLDPDEDDPYVDVIFFSHWNTDQSKMAKFTIKDHTYYNNEKQTEISRVVFEKNEAKV